MNFGAVIINPNNMQTQVTFQSPSGASAVVYSDPNGQNTVSQPIYLTSTMTVYIGSGPWQLIAGQGAVVVNFTSEGTAATTVNVYPPSLQSPVGPNWIWVDPSLASPGTGDNVSVGYDSNNLTLSDDPGAQATGSPGSENTGIGWKANAAVISGSFANTSVGYLAGFNITTGGGNTAIGTNTVQSVTTGNYNTGIGQSAGVATPATVSNATSLGAWTDAKANGAVAIGVDHTQTGAQATVQDQIVIGTANHQIQISNNTTGSGSALLGSNCPATTVSAPYTWLKLYAGDGSTVYVPVWK